MANTLAPTTSIIMTAAQSGMTAIDAVSEFVDNSFGPAAGNADEITIIDANDGILFWDKGNGVDDVNKLFRLGDGSSRNSSNDIGRFGVGSKFGALTFGTTVQVYTVRNGIFHKFTVNWEDVMNSGVWPNAYAGKGSQTVPPNIRNMIGKGGTIVLVTNLRTPKRKIEDETYIKRLGVRFMPSFETGKEINVYRADTFNKALQGKYRKQININEAFKEFFSDAISNVQNEKLTVNGNTVLLKYGELPTGERALSGIHITFGGRVIDTVVKVRDKSLPSKFFARVDLGKGYKEYLNYNKTVLLNGQEEIVDAVLVAAADLLEKLQNEADEAEIEKMTADINNYIDPNFGTKLFKGVGTFTLSDTGEEAEHVVNGEFRGGTDNPVDPSNPRNETQDGLKTEGDTHRGRGSFRFNLVGVRGGADGDAIKCDLEQMGKAIVANVICNRDVKVIDDALKNRPRNKPSTALLCGTALSLYLLEHLDWLVRFVGPVTASDIMQTAPEVRSSVTLQEVLKRLLSNTTAEDEDEEDYVMDVE